MRRYTIWTNHTTGRVRAWCDDTQGIPALHPHDHVFGVAYGREECARMIAEARRSVG